MQRLIVLNPTSRNGKAATVFQKLAPELRSRLGDVSVYETKAAGDARGRVRAALKEGAYDQILVAGGDGTINEAVNGYFENGEILSNKVPLGVINLGTGGDFNKTIQEVSGLYDVAVKENAFKLIDCGRVLPAPGETPHYFINIASIGLGGQVLKSLKKSRFQWGAPAYYYHTIKSLLLYTPAPVQIRYLDTEGKWHELDAKVVNCFVCNGRYSGGGMNWAPAGDVQDGVFQLVLIAGVAKSKLITDSYKIYSGRIAEFPGVRLLDAREVVFVSGHDLIGEADGEVFDPSKNQETRVEMLPSTFPLVI